MEPKSIDYERVEPPANERNPDPGKTLFKAFAVIVMFVISVFGLVYVAHMLWTGK